MVLTEQELVARLKNGESLTNIAEWFLRAIDYPGRAGFDPFDFEQWQWQNKHEPTPFEEWFLSGLFLLLSQEEPAETGVSEKEAPP